MLDILQLHIPEDNRDARCWILAKGKDLRNEINFLYSSLLEKMTKDELIRQLNKYTGINLEINLGGLTPREWLKNNVRKLRIKKGFTKKEIARLTGTSGRDWTRFEESTRLPNCKKLRKIVDILGIKIESVCHNDDFCLRSLDVVIKSLKEREWIPLIVIHGLLEIYKEIFRVKRKNFNVIKAQIITLIEYLKVNHHNSLPIKTVKKIDEYLANIIGAFAADGNYYPPDMIRWEEEHKGNLKALSKWFNSCFGLELKVKPEKRGRKSFTIKFRNKIIGRYLEVFFGFLPRCKKYIVDEPELIKRESLRIRKAFAKGALMFDGSVNSDGSISFYSISKKFRDSIAEILLKDEVKISVSKNLNRDKLWNLRSSSKLTSCQLRKLSSYFESGTIKRKILDFYLGDLKIDDTYTLRVLFSKIRSKPHPTDLIKLINRSEFDVYHLIKITGLSRKVLLTHLRILENANLIKSEMQNRRRIYSINFKNLNSVIGQ